MTYIVEGTKVMSASPHGLSATGLTHLKMRWRPGRRFHAFVEGLWRQERPMKSRYVRHPSADVIVVGSDLTKAVL